MEENLKQIFDTEYSKNKVEDFRIKTEKLYHYYGYVFNLNLENNIEQDFSISVEKYFNNEYIDFPLSDITVIEFNNLYPKLISKLVDTNLKGFNEFYSKIINLYYEYRDYSVKKYINMVYGCLQSKESTICSNNMYVIKDEMDLIYEKMISEFKKYIIAINTDRICFRNFNEIEERFKNYINNIDKLNLTYSINVPSI